MKRLLYALPAIMLISLALFSCDENEEPFSTVSASDEPRILDPVFPTTPNGDLALVSEFYRDVNLNMELTVTPADFCTVTWYLDGTLVHEGKEIDINLKAGTYILKVVVETTEGKSTSRQGLIRVNPLPDDPWAVEKAFERIIVPGSTATLYGTNLDVVKAIIINNKSITDINIVDAGADSYIEYEVPADLGDGIHRVLFVDENGNEYGVNKVTVTSQALALQGANRTKANSQWRITGLNLDDVLSITAGGITVTEFSAQSATELVLQSPDLEPGVYKLTGKAADNKALYFYSNGELVTDLDVTFTAVTVLFEGHHYVSWDYEDGNPNKTFNLIGKDVFAAMSPGTVINIYYSLNPDAGYWQMQTTTAWWTQLPGTGTTDLVGDGVIELVLTQEMLDLIQAQDGFLCVGHGYYVDRVTLD